jgi:hypothetical protein
MAPFDTHTFGWTTSLTIDLASSRTLILWNRPSSVRLANAFNTFSMTNSSVSTVKLELEGDTSDGLSEQWQDILF